VTDDAGRAKRPRPTSPLQSVSRRLLEQTCWDSASARKLFASREDDASEGVREVIEKRLALLSAAHYGATGYKSLVDGNSSLIRRTKAGPTDQPVAKVPS
jgi:hypothetical protein